MPHSAPLYDALVVGAGTAGLASALALARQGLRPALLGPRTPLPAAAHPYASRVYALSPASQRWLQTLGAWGAIPTSRLAPVHGMRVTGDLGATVNLSAWQAGQADMAWIVEGVEVDRALRNAVQVFGIPWHEGSCTGLVRPVGDGPLAVQVSDGSTLRAQLVVGADGAGSALRGVAGIPVQRHEYHATGVVTNLDAAQPHQGIARQWFLGDSVLALLPLPDGPAGPQVSMVWSMPTERAQALQTLDVATQADALTRHLAHATGDALGGLRPNAPVVGFPLALQRAEHMVAPRVALVGDAAHVVHPLAGQGLNLALGDVAALAEAVAQRESFRAPHDARVLARYQRARAEPVAAMRLATDGLHHLFRTSLPPVAWLRNGGMQLVERLPAVKRWLVTRASHF